MPFWAVVTLLCGCAILTVVLYVILSRVTINHNRGMLKAIANHNDDCQQHWQWLWSGSLIYDENSLVEFSGIIISNAGITIFNQLDVPSKAKENNAHWESLQTSTDAVVKVIQNLFGCPIPVHRVLYYKNQICQINSTPIARVNSYEEILEALNMVLDQEPVIYDQKWQNNIFDTLHKEIGKAIILQSKIKRMHYLRRRWHQIK